MTTEPAQGPSPAGRLLGVDVARGLAIAFMVVIHLNRRADAALGPSNAEAAGPFGALLASPVVAGLTSPSVLFVMVAGVGLALASRADGSAWPNRIWLLRGALLVPVGLLLQELQPDDLPLAVILAQIGLLFVVAGLTPRLPTPRLWLLAGVATVLGPVSLEVVEASFPGLEQVQPELGDGPVRLLLGAFVTSSYPVLALVGPLWTGMALGRLDLSSPAVARRVTRTGLVSGVAVSALLVAVGTATATGAPEWLQRLGDASIRGSALAFVPNALAWSTFLLGASLLVAARSATLASPLALLGRFALTVYVLHLLLIGAAPEVLRTTSYVGAAGRAVVLCASAVVLASAWSRLVGPIGPLELVLRDATRRSADLIAPPQA